MSRKPEYRLGAMKKDNDLKNGNIGAAWISENGCISIVLNPFVQLPMQDGNLVLTLFPTREEKSE